MDLMKAAEGGFEGVDIEALRAYCDRMDIEYVKSNNAAALRKKLRDTLGDYHEKFEGDDTATTAGESDAPADAAGLVALNLRSQGKWGGRRRVIQLHRAMDHESTYPQFFAWGQLHCYIPFGVVASIPYPIYNILQITAGKRLVRKRKQDEEGRIFFEESWIPAQRFMYTDMGDDPETADLPTDIRDMVRRLYAATDGFKGYSERQYREMCARLTIDVPPAWEAKDMLGAIVARCSLSGSRVDLSRPEGSQMAATG